MSPDSVVMEVQFVRVPANQPFGDEELWRDIDEQCVATSVRRAMAQNGFRCGLIGLQVPDAVRALLEKNDHEGPSEAADPPLDEGVRQGQSRRIHCRPGHRNRILTCRQRDHLVALFQEDGIVRGNPYEGAQCLITMRCFPQGDGSVQLQLIPEIEHGPMRQRWIPGDGADWRLDADRDRKAFNSLAIVATLTPGQTLLLTCCPEMRGSLGYVFFTDDQEGTPQHRFVLIRVAQSQLDVLFAPQLAEGAEGAAGAATATVAEGGGLPASPDKGGL
jgi:hypothetical protein